MKEKIIALIFFVILMALIPFAVSKFSESKTNVSAGATADIVVKSTQSTTSFEKSTEQSKNDDKLTALVAAKYKSTYCTETIKALAVILNNNYAVNPKEFDDNDFLYKDKANNTVKEVYSQIQNAVDSVKNTELTLNGKKQYIPFSDTSNGRTYKDNKYPFLCSVASPWDCFDKYGGESTKCTGVSINGINSLCRQKENFDEALKWYLPNFEIK